MIQNNELKRYQKKYDYSYTFGNFPTFELLKCKSECAEKILYHSLLKDDILEKLTAECSRRHIELLHSDRIVEKIRDKESCILVGVFRKYEQQLVHNTNHVVLVNPSDSGNLGTILRTCTGFGIHDIAVIEPAVDLFAPKVIRASMGSIFHARVRYYESFDIYYKEFGSERMLYPFMLKGARQLGQLNINRESPFSLIFGNEASGLDDSFLQIGSSVLIQHSNEIDSLNLSMAVGIALFEFTKDAFKMR